MRISELVYGMQLKYCIHEKKASFSHTEQEGLQRFTQTMCYLSGHRMHACFPWTRYQLSEVGYAWGCVKSCLEDHLEVVT